MNALHAFDEITEKIQQHKVVLLMLDFDGTLSPIAPTPEEATITQEVRDTIKHLSEKEHYFVAIISGRQLKDIKGKIALSNLFYAGNHGLEKEIHGIQSIFALSDATKRALVSIKENLQNVAEKYPGSFVEDKELVVTLHYRKIDENRTADLEKDFHTVFDAYRNIFALTQGKKIFEVKPSIDIHKGTIAREFVEKVKEINGTTPLAFYIGDDTTDEDAFKALPNGITIRVGDLTQSSAKYSLENPKEVAVFLEKLSDL